MLIIASAMIGCNKEVLLAIPPSTRSLTPPNPIIANAGPDITIEIPKTSVQLAGSATSRDNNFKSYIWEKISGPESYFLEKRDRDSTKVFWMEEGEYEFELRATDSDWLVDRDTIKVTVFSNLKKYVINDLRPDRSGFSTAPIPNEVANHIQWVFAKSGGRYEQADAGPSPGTDYGWGGYYYNLLPGNKISVFGKDFNDPTIDITIYY
jgi:hypothetical protein